MVDVCINASKIGGIDVIFVTVGSREYQFNRLFKKLDSLYGDGKLTDSMFAQTGFSTYMPQHYESKDFISPDDFLHKIQEADIIVSHGASGSIMKALNAGKKVIAVTRLEKYKEHINDHQIQNNIAFSSNGYVLMADLELNNLDECFKTIYEGRDNLIKWENNNPLAIVQMIDNFIAYHWQQ
jgi:UDP-N-acetylglucosamine transferase subunit ALG13